MRGPSKMAFLPFRAGRVAGILLALMLAFGAAPAGANILVSGFEGTSQLDDCAVGNCFRPPDTMGAIGTTQFLETTNGTVTVYNRASGAVLLRQNNDIFWQNAGQPGGTSGDQRVLFDHYTNRWIAVGFGGSVANINVAVSDTANALGTWRSTTFIGFAGGTADYPTLGMDDKGVYIGTNNFNSAPSFQGTSLFVIPKADLFGGAPTTANMTSFTTPVAGPDNGYSIQGAVNWGGNPTNTVNVLAASRDFFDVVGYQVTGVNGPGALQTAASYLALAAYGQGTLGRQPDGTRLVDTLDDRISGNIYQANGKVYAIHTVSDGTYTRLQWIVTNAGTGALIAQGFLGEVGYDYYQGSIAVNQFGEIVVGYNRSGFSNADANTDGKPDGNISFFTQAFRDYGDGVLVALGAANLHRVSDVSDYRCGSRTIIDTTCRQRWGDYAAVTIDPLNPHSFWAIGEYAAAWAIIPGVTTTERAIWHTFIAEVTFTADVAEPGSLALFLVGLGALAAMRRQRAACRY